MNIKIQAVDIVAKSEPRNRRKKKQGSGNEDIISMTNVTKSYATGAPALNGIDLHIKPGDTEKDGDFSL